MPFIDAHTHVQFAAYQDDWEEVIERARRADVRVVNVGTQRDTSIRAIEIAEQYPDEVYAVVGLHPVHTSKSYYDANELGSSDTKGFMSRGEVFDPDHYRSLAEKASVVAIGECGFDFFRMEGDEEEIADKQTRAFMAQVELAVAVKKPLMIHTRSGKERNAPRHLISCMRSRYRDFAGSPGIIHFFTGTPEEAGELLDMGFFFTFGGVITFTDDYNEVIRRIPLDRIMSETDAPYVTPVPYRGKRNEPSYVVEVVKRLGELRGMTTEDMKERIWENARTVFGI